MNSILKAAIGLAIVISIITVIFVAVGLHKNPTMGLLFIPVAIILNGGMLFWGLRGTATESGYLKQVLNSLIFGLVAGALIFGVSMLSSTMLFPNSLDESKQAGVAYIESMTLPDDVKAAQIEKIEATTPAANAMQGAIGTIFTSLFLGLILSIFLRKK